MVSINAITDNSRINPDAVGTRMWSISTWTTNWQGLLTRGARAGCLRWRAEKEQRQTLHTTALASPAGCTDFRSRHRGTWDEIIRRFEQRQTLLVVVVVVGIGIAGACRWPDVVVILVGIILLLIAVFAADFFRLHDVRRQPPPLAGRGVLLQGIRVVRGPVPGPRAVVNSLSTHCRAIRWFARGMIKIESNCLTIRLPVRSDRVLHMRVNYTNELISLWNNRALCDEFFN